MQTYWTKYYRASDSLSEHQFPSWSKSKLTDMIGASITLCLTERELFMMRLMEGEGIYHQSDDYQATFLSNSHQLIRRRLQFQLPNGQWLTKELSINNLDVKEYVSVIRI